MQASPPRGILDSSGVPVHTDSRADNRDRATGAFLACLNHEVRTPLSGIIGMVDLLLETRLDEEQKDYVQATRACAEQLSEILNLTLAYSALEAGQYRLDNEEFSLRDTLEIAAGEFQEKAKERGLELHLQLAPGLPETLVGDGPRVKDLLSHLLSNAVKFTHTGSVKLAASVKGGNLVLAVEDTGIGIPPDRMGSLFESFRQGETGLSRAYAGMGLGLAVAQGLTALMKGNIEVESQVGLGSTFMLTLPLREPGKPEGGEADSIINANSQGPLIMAVDDNPVGLKVLRHMLGRRHLRVECFESAREGLLAAGSKHYDIVLMDLQMPEMDGISATQALKLLPGYANVPVVALTANYADQVREQCLRAGMKAFLTKPVESEALLATIVRLLQPEKAQ